MSNPKSPAYGRYLSDRSLAQLMAPQPADVQAVRDTLAAAGIRSVRLAGTGDMLRATMTVAQAEQLFNIRIESFEHVQTSDVIARSLDELTLPPKMADAVELVYGLSSFPNLHLPKKVGVWTGGPRPPTAY